MLTATHATSDTCDTLAGELRGKMPCRQARRTQAKH
jgi:hypothetical protein